MRSPRGGEGFYPACMNLNRSSRRIVTGICLLAALAGLPGCVVNDIHTEMMITNQRLADLEVRLDEVRKVNEQLEAINEDRLSMLASIDRSLISIDESLVKIEGQLNPIGESLSSVDEHLASLRRTINNIDSTIPFLKISGDGKEEQPSTGEPVQEPATDAPPESPAAPPTPESGQPGAQPQ